MNRAPEPPATIQQQEDLAAAIEASLRFEYGFLRRARFNRRRRKLRIPDGLFAYLADQAAWHVIRSTQDDQETEHSRRVAAMGDRSIAIGGDATGTIHTGDQA